MTNMHKIDQALKPDSRIVFACNDSLQFTKTLPDNSVKLIITSPPYNIGKSYETRVSIEEYLKTQKEIIQELYRVLSPEGSIVWQVGNYVEKGEVFPLDIYYYPIFKELGMQLRNRIVWHFGHGLHASKRFSGRYETLLWFTKNDQYTFNLDDVRVPSKYPGKKYYKGEKKGQISGNPLGKNPTDFWEILQQEWEKDIWDIPNVKSNHPEKTNHPCQFPIELVERCILALTNQDDFVFDPFAGVASSLVAAVLHDRKALGVDWSQEYIDLGIERLTQAMNGTIRKRPLGQPVYVPSGRDKVSKYPEEWKKDVLTLCES